MRSPLVYPATGKKTLPGLVIWTSRPAICTGDLRRLGRLRQLDLAPADHRGGGGRHNRADVAIGRLIEVDDHGRVVARPAALARLTVDPGRPRPRRHGVAGQDQVDPHAEVLVEHARTVVPIGEDARSRPALADHVVEAVPD